MTDEIKGWAGTRGEWTLHEEPKWPFDIKVLAGENEVLDVRRCAYSTADKSLADVMGGVSFAAADRADVVAVNRQQMDDLRLLANTKRFALFAQRVAELSSQSDLRDEARELLKSITSEGK